LIVPAWAGWSVLSLVFLDEVLAVVALGDVGRHVAGWAMAVPLVVLAVAAWWAFASPKAPYGGPLARPVVKVLVFGAACTGLAWAGHTGAAVALLVFSVVVNAAAALPSVRHQTEGTP
jgi:hypothetical protein